MINLQVRETFGIPNNLDIMLRKHGIDVPVYLLGYGLVVL